MERLGDYLRIGEAASYLGVSAGTLRNWERTGKITTFRHPLNSYRLYRRRDLDEILRQIGESGRGSSRRGPVGEDEQSNSRGEGA